MKREGEGIKYPLMARIPPGSAAMIKEKLQETIQNLSQDGGHSKRILRHFEAKPELLEIRRMGNG